MSMDGFIVVLFDDVFKINPCEEMEHTSVHVLVLVPVFAPPISACVCLTLTHGGCELVVHPPTSMVGQCLRVCAVEGSLTKSTNQQTAAVCGLRAALFQLSIRDDEL